MSTLTLVRHGQARSFEPDHALTSMGEAQAARLAEYWLRNGVRFDEVWSGTLARQVGTERVVAERFCAAGEPWPEPHRDARWNEYDAPGVLAHLVPHDPEISKLAAAYEEACGAPEENRRFQAMLEAAMLRWLAERVEGPHVELWPAFRSRLNEALEQVRQGPSGRRVAVFTSGGPIGFTTRAAMQAADRTFLEVNWRVRNGSVTQFVFDRDRFTLEGFNCVGHLERELWTYR